MGLCACSEHYITAKPVNDTIMLGKCACRLTLHSLIRKQTYRRRTCFDLAYTVCTKKVKVRVWGLFSTAACRPIVPLPPNELPSFISRGATHHIGTRYLYQRRRELYKEFCQHIVIHGGTRFFYMPQTWDMGGFFRRLRPGLNPRTRVPEASMLTTRPPKPSLFVLTLCVKTDASFNNSSTYNLH